MTGEQIYARFRKLFPNLVYELKSFIRVSPNTIDLKTKSNRKLVFVYISDTNFMLKIPG